MEREQEPGSPKKQGKRASGILERMIWLDRPVWTNISFFRRGETGEEMADERFLLYKKK